jgi:ribonuclease-3
LEKANTWLKQSLHYEFSDERLLKKALTHRSAAGDNNERFEFLGDAVLQIVISEWIFAERPDASEGQLSRLRSSLVKDATLAEIAVELGVGEHLILGSGEKKSGGHRRSSILADTVEAIFAAVYIDAGFDAARQVIRKTFSKRIEELPEGGELRDPKSRLQEYLQSRQLPLPDYRTENVTGRAHKQSFEISCTIKDPDQTTNGKGTTRRDAEQDAAGAMLARIDSQEWNDGH